MKSGGNPNGQWRFFFFVLLAIAAAVIIARLSDRSAADATTSIETWGDEAAVVRAPPVATRMQVG